MKVENITDGDVQEYSVYDGHEFYRVAFIDNGITVSSYEGSVVKAGEERAKILMAVQEYRQNESN